MVQAGEKVGVIGRNGVGKSTLFGVVDSTDTEFTGTIERMRGLITVSTLQEHHGYEQVRTLDYIVTNLPEFAALQHVIETYPGIMGDDMDMIGTYTDALSRFGELGYFDVRDRAQTELEAFQIDRPLFEAPLGTLSGGQKRLVELVKVTLTDAHLALIDEPTNHMDYVAKAAFVAWLQAAKQSVMVVTHDRDVLDVVDRIIEIKDHVAYSFKGNYRAYLTQNGAATSRAIETYEQNQKRVVRLDKQIREARARKAGWSGTADKTNPFMLLERRLTAERTRITEQLAKPDFWIDQETVDQMRDNVVERYDAYKSRNIRLGMGGSHRHRVLVTIKSLALGYGAHVLFRPVDAEVAVGDRVRLHGRNGVGKSTLVGVIRALAGGLEPASRTLSGSITLNPKLIIGVYDQEVDSDLLAVPLGEAVRAVYTRTGRDASDQAVKQVLSDYLFHPVTDARLTVGQLSGGQKARFQLISLLAARPNLLILDEPTNHLDLPSIEELEKALAGYEGAVLYISHDSYFSANVGGEVIDILPAKPA